MNKILGILAGALSLASTTVLAAIEPFYGYAYDLKSNAYLYTEVHIPSEEAGRIQGHMIRYYAPDGALLGVKTLDYRNNRYVPIYRQDLKGSGYSEGIRQNRGKVVMFKTKATGKSEETEDIALDGLMAADSGFNNLLVDNLDRLNKGEDIAFRFAVAGQLDSYKFVVKKDKKRSVPAGQLALKLEANSVLKYLAPDIFIVYDLNRRSLLEYRGVSNIHDAKGTAYNVKIVYPSTPPAGAPAKLPPLP